MEAEIKALHSNNTWDLVTFPPDREPVGCKWVSRVKQNPNGSLNKYKARLVAKGFHQRPGLDFNETFSPMVKLITIRIILTLALSHNWELQQLDVNNAFLNGDLNESVYMKQPPGFQINKNLVCKLKKALYGLKQAPWAWFEKLTHGLVSLDFRASKCDPSLFVYSHGSNIVYMLIYVDDIIVTGNNNSLISSLVVKLHSAFP
jgi:histone deacetylase 1/2